MLNFLTVKLNNISPDPEIARSAVPCSANAVATTPLTSQAANNNVVVVFSIQNRRIHIKFTTGFQAPLSPENQDVPLKSATHPVNTIQVSLNGKWSVT